MADIWIDRLAWIKMDKLSPIHLNSLRVKYTIKQRGGDRFGRENKIITMYEELDGCIGIPRGEWKVLADYAGVEHKFDDRRSEVKAEFPKPNFGFREGQEEFVNSLAMGIEKEIFGGAGRAQGGFGKTICSLFLFHKLGLKTLVLVHKEFLLTQWEERIRSVFGNIKIGKIWQDNESFADAPITIGMVGTFTSRSDTYTDKVWKGFGVVLSDEYHRVGAPTWYDAVKKFHAKYMVGVSATPRRSDGTEDVFKLAIGKVVAKSNKVMPKPRIFRLMYKNHVPLKHYEAWPGGKLSSAKLINYLTTQIKRNLLIKAHVLKGARSNRKVLVLSHRVNHLSVLCALVEDELKKDAIVRTCSLYVGEIPDPTKKKGRRKMTDEERKAATAADVIFATYQYIAEGLDIASLDTVFLGTPMSDVEQSIYRIRREAEEKKPPLVVDLCDSVSFLTVGASKRLAYYQSEKFDVKDIEV